MSMRGVLPAIGILLASFAIAPAHATTAVVPDSFPTIQAGIDSWRDTVLVRGGRYDEDLVLVAGVTLATLASGAEPDTVETRGLRIAEWVPPEPWIPRPRRDRIDVRGFHFTGPVKDGPCTDHRYDIAFENCRMDSGLTLSCRLNNPRSIKGCTVLGGVSVATWGGSFYLTNNTILSGGVDVASEGFVSVTNNTVLGGGVFVFAQGRFEVRDNRIRGPAPIGITTSTGGATEITGNTVVGTDIGIRFAAGEGCAILRNEVSDCSGSAFLGGTDMGGRYEHNRVARCGGYGFDLGAGWYTTTRFRHNQVVACAAGGVRFVRGRAFIADSNRIGRCGGPAFDIEQGATLRGNTAYLSQGAGFIVRGEGMSVANNIGYGNSGVGLSYLGTGAPTLTCNDWFANAAGATSGTPPGSTDLAVDPLFCDAGGDDVYLRAGSPLLDAPGCGRIGALGQGCPPVPMRFALSPRTLNLHSKGRWVSACLQPPAPFVAEDIDVDSIRLDGTVPVDGQGPVGIGDQDGDGVRDLSVKFDRTALGLVLSPGDSVEVTVQGMVSGRPFEGSTSIRVSGEGLFESTAESPGEGAPAFALDPVRPNPCRDGSVVARFRLPAAAPASLELLDVAGRLIVRQEVTAPGAGWHALDLGQGLRLPPGLYLVRLSQGANTRTTRVAVLR